MVIQRIQSLLLLLAAIAVALFIFIPYGYWDAAVAGKAPQFGPLVAKAQPALLIPSIIAIILIVVSIFLYKKMPLQKSLVALSGLVVTATACVVVYMLTRSYVDVTAVADDVTIKPLWGLSGALLIAALVALVAAHRCISSDQRLLRSYDRLR